MVLGGLILAGFLQTRYQNNHRNVWKWVVSLFLENRLPSQWNECCTGRKCNLSVLVCRNVWAKDPQWWRWTEAASFTHGKKYEKTLLGCDKLPLF